MENAAARTCLFRLYPGHPSRLKGAAHRNWHARKARPRVFRNLDVFGKNLKKFRQSS